MKKKRKYFKSKFMFNHKSKHPAWVFNEDHLNKEYDYVSITHAKITDYDKNIELPKNPDLMDTRKSRVRPKPFTDKKKYFSADKKGLVMHQQNRKYFYRIKRKKK